VAAADRQRVLAVAIFAAERVLGEVDGLRPDTLQPASTDALAQAPQAAAWARDFIDSVGLAPRGFRRHAAPKAVRCAVIGTAQACISTQDELLRTMLEHAIRDARHALDREQVPDGPSVDSVTGEVTQRRS
jgi:hypothetical protein